jgi:protein SCO1/2
VEVGRSAQVAQRARRALWIAAGLWAAALGAAAQPAPLAGLKLQDHRLQPLAAPALAGRPVLLHFVFAGCSSVCPLQLQELRQLHDTLPADVRARVSILSVTVDPLSDTPAALAAFARRHDTDRPGWHFVSGAPAEVHRLLDRLQAFESGRRDPDAHRTSLYLYAPDGRLLQRFRGSPVDRVRLADELQRLVRSPA